MDDLEKIEKELAALLKKKEELINATRIPVLEDVKAKIAKFNFTAKELGLAEVAGKKAAMAKPPMQGQSKGVLPAKYKLGKNEWSGRGRQPKWLEDHLKGGGTLEEVTVK